MPYDPEKEKFYQSPQTIVDSTPDGDSVKEGFDDRLTPAMDGVYQDMNLLKENGMIGVGLPATETARGVGRVATAEEVQTGKTGENGPAFVDVEKLHVEVIANSPRFDSETGKFYCPSFIGDQRNFSLNAPPEGWAVKNGGWLDSADVDYPELWANLHHADYAFMVKTVAEYNTLSTRAGGVGGVMFFAVDEAAKRIRLPDTRGDYEREAGSSYLPNVGDWHGDAIRNITGYFGEIAGAPWYGAGGAFSASKTANSCDGNWGSLGNLDFYASRVVPTAGENRTRTDAKLGCVCVKTTPPPSAA